MDRKAYLHKSAAFMLLMRPILLPALVATCWGLGLPGARAQSRGTHTVDDNLLLRFIAADPRVNLRGYQIDEKVDPQGRSEIVTSRINRSSDGRSQLVCLEPREMHGVMAVEDGRWRWDYDPHKKVMFRTPLMPRSLDELSLKRTLRLIRRNYTVTLEGKESCAGRSCLVLYFVPRDAAGYRLKVWIDAATGVLLHRVKSDSQGHTLEYSMFSSVEYPKRISNFDLVFHPAAGMRLIKIDGSQPISDMGKLRHQVGFDICVPLWMPPGYEYDRSELSYKNGVPSACLFYTDGISTISIYEARRPAPLQPGHRTSMKLTYGWGGQSGVSQGCGQKDFAVMGDRKMSELRSIVQNLDDEHEHSILTRLSHSFGVSTAKLTKLRNRGMSIDTIGALLEIAARSGQRLELLVTLCQSGLEWRTLATQFNLNPYKIWVEGGVY